MHKKEMPAVLIVGIFALIVLIILMLPGPPKVPPSRATETPIVGDDFLAECPARNCILVEDTNGDRSWDTYSCLLQNTYTADGGFFCEAGRVISCGTSPTRTIHADDRAYHCRYLNIFTGSPPGSTSVQEGITTWYCDQYGQFDYDAQGIPVWFNVDKKPGKWTLTKPAFWDVDCGYVCKADSTKCSGKTQVVSVPGTDGQVDSWKQNQVIRGTTLQTCDSRGSAYADTVCSGMCIETLPQSVPPVYQGDYEWQARNACLSDKCPPYQGTMTEPEYEAAIDACESYCNNPDLYKSTYVQGSASCVPCVVNTDCESGSCVSGQCTGAVPPSPGIPSISITKEVNVTNVTAGSSVSYTLVVTSTGNATAYNVTLADVYPSSFVFINSTLVPTTYGNASYSGFFIGELAPNASVTVMIILNTTVNGTFNNTAYAGLFSASGMWLGWSYATAWTTVGGAPALYSNVSVTKTASLNDTMLTYLIVVTSTGTDTAYNVTLTEAYPSGVVFVSSTPAPTTGNDTFFLGDMVPNASITVTILMNVTVNGTYNNTASVVFAGGAGAGASSVGSTSTTIGPPPPAPAPVPSGGGGGGGGGGSRGGVLCPTYCIKDPKYADPNYPGYVYTPICSSPACLAMSKVVQPAPPISQPASTREIPVCNDNKKTYPENCDPPGSACNDNTGTCAADCMSCTPAPAQVVEAAPPEVPIVEAPPVEAPKVVKAKSKAWVAAIPVAVLIIGGIAYYFIRRRLLGMPL